MSKNKIMTSLLQDGRIIKEGFSGVYFLVNEKKLITSKEIHMNAGGDPKVFEAWEESQKNKDYFSNE